MNVKTVKYELSERCSPGNDPLFTFLKKNHEKPVSLSLNKVARMDALRLQMILSAQSKWTEKEISFEVTDVSESCSKSLSLLGLPSNHFQMDA